jgi:hypothetical protein
MFARVESVSRGCELGVVVLRCDEVGGVAGAAGESWRFQQATPTSNFSYGTQVCFPIALNIPNAPKQ